MEKTRRRDDDIGCKTATDGGACAGRWNNSGMICDDCITFVHNLNKKKNKNVEQKINKYIYIKQQGVYSSMRLGEKKEEEEGLYNVFLNRSERVMALGVETDVEKYHRCLGPALLTLEEDAFLPVTLWTFLV